MALERIILNIIPAGDMPVFHCSQYENGRPVIIDLISSDDDAFMITEGVTVELHCRKCDDTIVTMEPNEVINNTVTFVTSEQLTACPGDNLCELFLYSDTEPVQTLGSLNFILHVEPDPIAGGLTSESEISNLTQQIETIAQEVIGENYYDKTEVDVLLGEKADSDSVYTIGEVNTLLSGKANSSDVYTKAETDTLLSAKADSDDVYTKSETYSQAEVDTLIDNIFPTLTASGSIANFTTALQKPLVSVTADAGATTVTRCGKNFININGNVFDTEQNPDVAIPFENGLVIKGLSRDGYVRPANITKFEISGDNIVINSTSTSYGVGFAFRAVEGVTYEVSCDNTIYSACSYFDTDGYNISFTPYITGNRSFTIPSGCAWCVIIIAPISVNTDTTYEKPMVEIGNTATTYAPFNGCTTVPVSDATTLTTLSGVNNVFTDSGNVTVQYKYMSI